MMKSLVPASSVSDIDRANPPDPPEVRLLDDGELLSERTCDVVESRLHRHPLRALIDDVDAVEQRAEGGVRAERVERANAVVGLVEGRDADGCPA